MAGKGGCAGPVFVVIGIGYWFFSGLAGVVGTGIFWLVPYVIPEAKLERDSDGLFIVDPYNFDDWMTYSAVFSNISGKVGYGKMQANLRVRSLPVLNSNAPARIKNASNYRSQFYSVNFEEGDIVLITAKDDEVVSTYQNELLNRVKSHNDAVVASGYDTMIRFEQPELEIEPVFEFGFWNQAETWMRNCTSQGCPVDVKVEYSSTYFDGPNVKLVGSGLILKRR